MSFPDQANDKVGMMTDSIVIGDLNRINNFSSYSSSDFDDHTATVHPVSADDMEALKCAYLWLYLIACGEVHRNAHTAKVSSSIAFLVSAVKSFGLLYSTQQKRNLSFLSLFLSLCIFTYMEICVYTSFFI